jgi:hypothetical protein
MGQLGVGREERAREAMSQVLMWLGRGRRSRMLKVRKLAA